MVSKKNDILRVVFVFQEAYFFCGGLSLLCLCVSAVYPSARAGEEIWVEDPKKVWALASLVSQHNTILKVKRKDTGELVDIDLVSERPTSDNPWRAVLVKILAQASCRAFCAVGTLRARQDLFSF